MATCDLCNEHLPEDDMNHGIAVMIHHLRTIHPDEYRDGPLRWPDGAFVVEDTTLVPDDFNEETS